MVLELGQITTTTAFWIFISPLLTICASTSPSSNGKHHAKAAERPIDDFQAGDRHQLAASQAQVFLAMEARARSAGACVLLAERLESTLIWLDSKQRSRLTDLKVRSCRQHTWTFRIQSSARGSLNKTPPVIVA